MKEYLKFLPSYKRFIELGFTEEELLKSINRVRIDKDDLVDVKEVEQLPTYCPYIILKDNYIFELKKKIPDERFADKRLHIVNVTVTGYLIEIPASIILESELFHSLLSNRFSYFNNNTFTKVVEKTFKTKGSLSLKSIPTVLKDWKVSELLSQEEITYYDKESRFKTYRPNSEIYLETDIVVNGNFQSIYIPLDALFSNDWDKVKERHEKYHKEYYGKFKPELLEPSLSVLESEQALKLKEITQNKIEIQKRII